MHTILINSLSKTHVPVMSSSCGRSSATPVMDAGQGTHLRCCHLAVPLFGGQQLYLWWLQELPPPVTYRGCEEQLLALEGQGSP